MGFQNNAVTYKFRQTDNKNEVSANVIPEITELMFKTSDTSKINLHSG
jgi:hypothetical protein